MNFVQTLFAEKADLYKNSFGWVSPECHLMGWTLSCLQLNRVYEKITLHGNSNALKILVDKMDLPYYNVSAIHDEFLLPNSNLWALPKIFTYSKQKEPFIHFDGDVFVFDELPKSFLLCDLVAQNIEEASEYYFFTQKQIMEHFSYLPDCVRADFNKTYPIKAINAGVIGGNNIDFIQEYSRVAFKYINDNTSNLTRINVDGFNVFFEQHLFYSLAKQKGISIDVLFQELITDNEYLGFGDFHETPFKKNYLHLLGHYKRDEFTCIQMASRLRSLYPEYFYRILSLFKKNNSRHILGIYADKEFNSLNEYLEFNKKAKLMYAQWISGSKKNNGRETSEIVFSQLSEVSAIKQFIKDMDYSSLSCTKEDLNDDFDFFVMTIESALGPLSKKLTTDHLYGRDLNAEDWYSYLFSDETMIHGRELITCAEACVLKSTYDWAGLISKWKRKGARYYENLELETGQYYSVVVPEFFGDKFSIYDLDEMEKIILDKLSNPLSIGGLIDQMKEYVDEEVLNEHFEKYVDLIIVFVKQLVLKKAVKPVTMEVLS